MTKGPRQLMMLRLTVSFISSSENLSLFSRRSISCQVMGALVGCSRTSLFGIVIRHAHLYFHFDSVGGFVHFHSVYPEICENKIWKFPGLTALSQPCLPTTSVGPTRILPFLYLGSEDDANNRELLQVHIVSSICTRELRNLLHN